MTRPFTVQCAYAAYHATTVTVEADTLGEALEKAIEAANRSDAWRSPGHCGNTFVEAVCEGAEADSRSAGAALRVPDCFTERGEPPVIAITDPARSGGAVEIVRGRVLLRFTGDAGTVVSELCDPPPPPGNKPLVTVSLDARGKPLVKVEQGRARVRILDG